MAADNDPDPDLPLFCAKITPHRSLGRTGFIVFMAAIGVVSFVAGMVFLIAGAWPVFGFFGLDVALLYWAFRANYRAAAASEVITVTASELSVHRINHRGEEVAMTFNPRWVQLEKKIDPDYGLETLFLVARGRRYAIAGFLSPREKEGFAAALLAALHAARRGPARTAIA